MGQKGVRQRAEAYINRFGMDSIATISEQSEAEAKEAEYEGAIRTLGSKLLTASLSVASYDDPLNSADLIFATALLPHTPKNKVR